MRPRTRRAAAAGLVLAAALWPALALAQAEGHGGDGHGAAHGPMHGSQQDAQAEAGGSDAPDERMAAAREAYLDAVAAMHEAMADPPTGDADADFARGMIGHHEGAILMARVVLEHGTDPELRALAEAIIETQSAEIEILRAWLARQAP